jgi:hypothetical protein
MRRIITPMLTLVMACAPGFALGQGSWFVIADPVNNCEIVNHPAGRWEHDIAGPYATIAEATTAMFRATVCLQGPIAMSKKGSWYYSFGQFAPQIPRHPASGALHP